MRAKITKQMAEHIATGQKGEEVAAIHLLESGYEILATNWRIQRAEVDILAMDQDVLVCVEVKTRSTSRFGEPYEFVNRRKQRMLRDATVAFALRKGHDGEIRFDVISVIQKGAFKLTIRHLKDAFHF